MVVKSINNYLYLHKLFFRFTEFNKTVVLLMSSLFYVQTVWHSQLLVAMKIKFIPGRDEKKKNIHLFPQTMGCSFKLSYDIKLLKMTYYLQKKPLYSHKYEEMQLNH